MAYIVDEYHSKKLKKHNINIKTKYIVGNKILERNSNNSYNDDINLGIICEKDYFINNEIKLQEKEFDSRIEYSYIIENTNDLDYTCPNCGMSDKLKKFIDGCPYCKTSCNIEYIDKDLGSKYHYDRVLKNNLYRIVTFFIDLVISIILSYIFIKNTSRTFNNIDILKIFTYGFILSIILYYFFYLLDAYIILGPIKKYKDKINQKQIDFWNKTKLDRKKFYNNFNYEISKYYYEQDNIIDYDILDYLNFDIIKKDDNIYIDVIVEIRIIYIINNCLKRALKHEKFRFRKNNDSILETKNGINIIKCYNCGASININNGECNYCHSKIKYLQEWILEK